MTSPVPRVIKVGHRKYIDVPPEGSSVVVVCPPDWYSPIEGTVLNITYDVDNIFLLIKCPQDVSREAPQSPPKPLDALPDP
jgi:hypothetical protein